MVRTSSDAERLESQLMAAGGAAAGGAPPPGIQVVEVEPQDGRSSAPVDRELVRMALEAQGAADCGVSWYYTDKDGNVSKDGDVGDIGKRQE